MMNLQTPEEYEEKTVKILDALASEDLGPDGLDDNGEQKYTQGLHLLLQDVETKNIFQTILLESDVRRIINAKYKLSSKQMIDLAILLRAREEPLRLMVPKSSNELTVDDILQSRELDAPKPKRRYNKYRNKRRKTSNPVNENNK